MNQEREYLWNIVERRIANLNAVISDNQWVLGPVATKTLRDRVFSELEAIQTPEYFKTQKTVVAGFMGTARASGYYKYPDVMRVFEECGKGVYMVNLAYSNWKGREVPKE